MNYNIIELSNISKTYRGSNKPSVDNLSFVIQKGESVAFLGPNGSGKTSTIKMIIGLMLPNSGQVSCMGFEPFKHRRLLSRKVACMFGTQMDLWGEISLKKNIELQASLYGLNEKFLRRKIDEEAQIFNLDKLLERKPVGFSTGEKMRSLLFTKMIHSPDLLILDEPTLGMDIEIKEEMRLYLKKINKINKTTILLTSHDIGDIEGISERVLILNKGQLVIDKSIEELKQRPLIEEHLTTNYIPLEKIILSIYREMRR